VPRAKSRSAEGALTAGVPFSSRAAKIQDNLYPSVRRLTVERAAMGDGVRDGWNDPSN